MGLVVLGLAFILVLKPFVRSILAAEIKESSIQPFLMLANGHKAGEVVRCVLRSELVSE